MARGLSESLRLLLASSVDYAGLFPPAELDMATAVRCYEEYRASEYAWMLGNFVAPAGRLAELAALARRDGPPWSVNALVGPNIAGELDAIEEFQHTGTGRVEWIEVKVSSAEQIRAIRERVPRRLGIYFEFTDLALMKAVRDAGARAKVRTGGATAEAIPAAVELARFMVSAGTHEIPLKATAGLHHPVRSEYALTYKKDSQHATMHGFVNVLLAAVFACHGVALEELTELLEERSPGAFGFEPDGVTWRYHRLTNMQIRCARERAVASFGSCSFIEPVEELRAAGLL
ncbi:MAG TPA: hypothetical protein VFL57_12055 [Bryobacteraceae bacterium]|nr:hypothetical protein [Bryobacteraceae bacterium]